MALIEVSVIPLGTGTPSVSQFVAKAVEVIRAEKGEVGYLHAVAVSTSLSS